ncbi:transport and Golgi organization protein 1 [Uranotaenia lowii]|uniref:transport and Golgi organization protein 1 n=1 Tax=Uranotaenia lowii TaxID=190385 RepID=UPI0024788322|nr:transport and Golgi organization protein 1 [Uranotaenia lowii]
MKKLNFTCFVHSLCLVLVLIASGTSAKECGDPTCKTPIGRGYATIGYMGGGGNKINLGKGEKVEILAANVGKDKDFWVRNSKGKEGLASIKIVREMEIIGQRKDRIIVPDEEVPNQQQQNVVVDTANIDPAKASNQQVVDGTTITTSPEPLSQLPEVTPPNPVDATVNTPELVTDQGTTIVYEQKSTESLPQQPELKTDPVEVNSLEPEAPQTGSSNANEQEAEDASKATSSSPTEDVSSEKLNENVEDTEDENEEDDSEDEEEDDENEEEEEEENIENNGDDTLTDGEKPKNNSVELPTTESDSTLGIGDPVTEKAGTGNVPDQTESLTPSDNLENKKIPEEKTTSGVGDDIKTEESITKEEPSKNSDTTNPTIVEAEESSNMKNEEERELNTINIVENEINKEANIDLRVEIPVTEIPEPLIEALPSPTDEVVKPIIAGGLSGLLSHHHHHHHHGHGHGHHHHDHGHHAHHHHHHNHDAGHDHQNIHQQIGEVTAQQSSDNQILPPQEPTANVVQHSHEPPFLGNQDQFSNSRPNPEALQEHDPTKMENEFCDQQACPPPNPAHDSSRQQASNGGGFHHPMVSGQQAFDFMATYQEQQHREDYDHQSALPPLDDGEDQDLDYTKLIVTQLIQLSDIILLLGITSFTLIVFSLGHYLINKNRKEKPLIYKLNMVERDLMASHKENAMLKADLGETKHKLTSIENNSFGSNDMVIALRQELEDAEQTKLELQEQIGSLEKELENAAEAGLELNKMVAELLNQSGSDSIALTVDELQKQLNEQQQTIMSMNNTLAEKSRENSELQVTLANQTGKFKEDQDHLQQAFNDLKLEKNNMEIELNNMRSGQNSQLEAMQKESSTEIGKLNKEVKSFQSKWEESKKSLLAAEAKIEALEECIQDIKKGKASGSVDGIIDSAEMKAKIAVLNKEKANLEDRLKGEIVARQLLDDHVKMINEDISTLKKEFSQAEKDKLEAETRLEVLSTYFKDKETQLQKELSIKEAMWMQQQGETTSTVERIRQMQDEIQQLKSQNDKLRVEIDAQTVAHKAQYTALETRSHEAWLAARQAERRLEESRVESSNLRRKLTALGDISVNNTSTDGIMANVVPPPADLGLTAPSPIRVESPNAPMMALPPPPFMPPPFGPPFMPPFIPPPNPGEMRPAPLGRLMSPPPNRYSPSMMENRGNDRYSPDRGRYSPDSRYDYSVMSNYETETDFSPPPSPPPHSRRSNYDRDPRDRDHHHRDHELRDRDRDVRDRDGRTSGNGGDRSTGSGGGYPKAFSPPSMRTTSPPIQDPRNKKYQGGFSSGSQDSVSTRKSGKQQQQFRNSKPPV